MGLDTVLRCGGREALFAVWMFCVSVLSAERLPIQVYTVNDGLAHNHINRIFRDSRAFLWFCTDEGLSHFDGHGFTSYTVRSGLPHIHVNSMLEARNGVYWIATDGGVCRLNPKGEPRAGAREPLFTVFRLGEKEEANHVNTIAEDESGVLWCGTDVGLYRLDQANGSVSPRPVAIGLPREKHTDPIVNTIVAGKDSVLWIGAGSGLYRYRAGRAVRFTTRNGLPDNYVVVLREDRNGRLWVGSRYGGLIRLKDDPDPEKMVVDRHYSVANGLAANDVRSVFESPGGKLRIGTTGGLSELTPDGRLLNYGIANGLSEAAVYDMAEDSAGNLWLGANHAGLMRVERSGLVTYGESDGFRAGEFNSILETRNGELCVWNGDNSGRWLQRFDGGKRFLPMRLSLASRPAEWGWGWQQVILQDQSGEWWIATRHGLARYARAKSLDQLARLAPKAIYTSKDGLPGDAILRLYEDKFGDIWIGTTSHPSGANGLTRWVRSSGSFQTLSGAPGMPPLKDAGPSAFREDSEGNIWIGFAGGEGGLVRYRTSGQTRAGGFERFTSADGAPPGNINSLYLDKGGRLWIASSDGGLRRVDVPAADKPRFTRFGTPEGLSSDEVWCVTEDRWGRVYAGTGRGVDRIEAAGVTRHYRVNAGKVQTAYRDRIGDLWFATTHDLLRLTPEPDPRKPAAVVYIAGLTVNGESYPLSALGETRIDSLELSSRQNDVQVDFAGLDFDPGAALRYQYTLEGPQGNWSPPTLERTAHYVRLTPGRYEFAVRAVGSGQQVSGAIASVAFRISPPFWQRWWFLLAAAICLASGIYGLHRSRVARLVALERLRTRIASDLHDDIGSNLSRIAILSEVARQGSGVAHTDGPLEKIATVSRETLRSMSDIVWAIDPEQDKLSELIHRMRAFASDLVALDGVRLRFRSIGMEREMRLGTDVRRQIFLIFKEAVHNAVRHSGATEVNIAASLENGVFQIEVQDDGGGIDPSRRHLGHGFASMEKRAGDLHGVLQIESGKSGTTIRLSVPVGGGMLPRRNQPV